MELIDRYIGKSIIRGVLMVLAVVLTLDMILTFVGESDDIGKANYDFWKALSYVILRIPQKIYQLFPLIALLGAMMGLGMLSGNHELIAIRAAGVSIARIMLAVTRVALLITVVVVFIGEVVAPPAVQFAKLQRLHSMQSKLSLNTEFGLWARDANSYIHVRGVEKDGRLIGINLYLFDEQNKLIQHTKAASGVYMIKEDEWLLHNVEQNDYHEQTVKVTRIPELRWQSQLKPEMVEVVSVTPEDLSVWRLTDYISYLKTIDINPDQYRLSFWNKVFTPLTIVAMVLLAVPFIFGTLRDSSVGQRILVGFLSGLVFYFIDKLTGQAGVVYNLPPLVAAGLPTVIVMVIAGILFYRLR